MSVTKEQIARINELARKAKTEGLTAEERLEQDGLRRLYLDSVKANLTAQLDRAYGTGPEDRARRLGKKDPRT